jgi:ATP-dependent helicase/nuclease subunit A
MMRDEASQAQVRAADPGGNVWLAANAGSGKTSVLTDRVARLLLNGVKPGSILCLTYTKAAASEMQNRLFERLGKWAMLADAGLAADLGRLGLDGPFAAEDLNRARRLFAQAIETPGGLRIQTIHSFCAGLLRRFPMEAGISPAFAEMEERAARLLQAEVLEDLAAGEGADAFADLVRIMGGEGQTVDLLSTILSEREALAQGMDRGALLALLGAPSGLTETDLLGEVFLGDEADWLAELVAVMTASPLAKVTDEKLANALTAAVDRGLGFDSLPLLEDALLTKSGKTPFAAKIGTIPTKDLRNALGPVREKFENLMQRVESTRPLRLALAVADRSAVLHRFAGLFLQEYNARKAARGALDFDDLIGKAKALLSTPSIAPWVLYRLDGGISHILVDEAQDTSPAQWQVIRLLADEILAGEGASGTERTIFVVGDKKQSIYSFQGANAEEFDRMRALFGERLAGAERGLADLTLEYSFRSSPLILAAVDGALTSDSGSLALGGAFRHQAYRGQMPGRIELWPPILPEPEPKDEDWSNPVDLVPPEHHAVRMARKIAERIGMMLAEGTCIPTKDGGERRLRAGDILILVQRRSELFAEILRALKQAGLPVAGADRMNLGGELAVKDLTALLAFLATPEDDLALAGALRSPLFGWTEERLYALAQGRKGYLWEALRNSGTSFGDSLAVLNDLRDQTDFLRPYDLIERMLTRHGGRERLLARLGFEAEDGIDALLAQALAYERSEVPSLTGFLAWMQTDEVTIKRQLEGGQDLIRVMTVHGAKGLEAPVVILPDTADRRLQMRDQLVTLADGTVVWRPTGPESPLAVQDSVVEVKAAAARESLRLLYVAMTRAQSWLIVGAAGPLKSQGADSGEDLEGEAWYDRIKIGVQAVGAVVTAEGGLFAEFGAWPASEEAGPIRPAVKTLATVEPGDIPAPQFNIRPLSPSDLGGAKALPGVEVMDPQGKARGTALHRLLEHLPNHAATEWPALAGALLDDPVTRDWALGTAIRLLKDQALAEIFAPGTLAEVAVTAALNGQAMLGSIDRLVIGADRVLAVDYKSNALVPETEAEMPEGIRRQLLAYATALGQIYPGRRIEVAVLWTATGRLMPLSLG